MNTEKKVDAFLYDLLYRRDKIGVLGNGQSSVSRKSWFFFSSGCTEISGRKFQPKNMYCKITIEFGK